MADVKIFPREGDLLKKLPPFPGEGLQVRRVPFSNIVIPLEQDIPIENGDSFAPLAAVEIDPNLGQQTSAILCNDWTYYVNDAMDRVTVSLSNIALAAMPAGSVVMPTPEQSAVQVEFQIRGTIASGAGALRWQGTWSSNGFQAANTFIGKTSGILVNRWELWGKVTGGQTEAPLRVTLQMLVDRVGVVGVQGSNQNQYGPDVTPVF